MAFLHKERVYVQMSAEYIAEELASVTAKFRTNDLNWLLEQLARVRLHLLHRAEADAQRKLIELHYWLNRLTIQMVKNVSATDLEATAAAAFDYHSADPCRLASAMGGYAGQCSAEGQHALGRTYLARAIEIMDEGGHWARWPREAEGEFRTQLRKLEADSDEAAPT